MIATEPVLEHRGQEWSGIHWVVHENYHSKAPGLITYNALITHTALITHNALITHTALITRRKQTNDLNRDS